MFIDFDNIRDKTSHCSCSVVKRVSTNFSGNPRIVVTVIIMCANFSFIFQVAQVSFKEGFSNRCCFTMNSNIYKFHFVTSHVFRYENHSHFYIAKNPNIFIPYLEFCNLENPIIEVSRLFDVTKSMWWYYKINS